ncbi:MAG: 3-methyl-2-oxobutanoate hydroxymethyltransferase [Candidatus Omnitrophota bacterium]
MKKTTILDFAKKKASGDKITMLTAYDHPMARIIDSAGIDAILVGDSVGMVVLGYDSTVKVTMREMIHHAKAVTRGVERAFVIADMPFMSYQPSDETAVRNAGRFLKEAACDAVKIELGGEMAQRAGAISSAGIPVVGHIGLTPQSSSKIGGYRVQGREAEDARKIMSDAVLLEEAGCFALILECIPSSLAREVTAKIGIPTIGIGAGPYCDGQVLVTYDIIGYFDKFLPKFAKRYANVGNIIKEAVGNFKKDIKTGVFPDKDHSFS